MLLEMLTAPTLNSERGAAIRSTVFVAPTLSFAVTVRVTDSQFPLEAVTLLTTVYTQTESDTHQLTRHTTQAETS